MAGFGAEFSGDNNVVSGILNSGHVNQFTTTTTEVMNDNRGNQQSISGRSNTAIADVQGNVSVDNGS